MSDTVSILAIVLSLLGGGTVGVIVVKWMNRPVDTATADQIKAEARKIAVDTTASELQNMKFVMNELQRALAVKIEENAELKADLRQLNSRLDKVEERERHMLARAGVHEGWVQMAFNYILQHDPEYPPPPALFDLKEITSETVNK